MTGCGHPQIDVILNHTEELFPVSHIAGGFHNFSKLNVFKNRFVVPVHCTREKEKILLSYLKNARSLKIGETFNF